MTRVAGLLILLYGVRPERIHQLTTADVAKTGERTYLTFATQPIELPPVMASLFDELILEAERTPSSMLRDGEGRHLFPSPKRQHEPVHPVTLGRWLARAGMSPHLARNHAMIALTTDLPAAVVSAQMGLTPQTTARWAQLSQRDNTEYLIARNYAKP